MSNQIQIVHRELTTKNRSSVKQFGVETAKKARRFHESFPGYVETPLVNLTASAADLGIKNLLVKDESRRFGLNAFKVLGGSYALGHYIASKLDLAIDALNFERMISPDVKQKLGALTFVTATDGNHGRGIAWTARQLGQKAVVYMPKGAQKIRLDNILAENADASITDLSYDDAVRFANQHAQEFGWVLVQDTAWEGYEEIPTWIMEGYTTMIDEAIQQLQEIGIHRPTHVFLQAGVGSMAGAVCAYLVDLFGVENKPVITVVEPQKADCNFQTAIADDGQLHCVTGEMDTMMAGLACGEPCTISWEILNDYADNFIACSDAVAARGMCLLGSPLAGDTAVISGESGAVTVGVVAEVMKNPDCKEIREILGLNEQSAVLCLSTEGDTDPQNYRRILWDKKFSDC